MPSYWDLVSVSKNFSATADFMKKVPGVYTHSVETIHLSLNAQVAVGTFFRKSPVVL